MASHSSTVRVDLAERSYDIEIGQGNLAGLTDFLEARADLSHVVVITDTNVDPLYADRLADVITEEGPEVHVLVAEAGEASKAAEVATDLWETMLEEGIDRQSIVLAIGGGVVGDLAGFVAATFARGLTFFQVPTTLLAQVDSSVGGKVGINLPGGKNMVGAFWQPAGVLIDVDVLTTLPDREYRAGLAEVVKYGVIMDADFFAMLEANVEAINQRDPEVLQEIIARCCQLKANVVQDDEKEQSGRRAILNYGHTFGHALEAATGYTQILHGEGVSIGMLAASRLATQLGMFTEPETVRQTKLLEAIGLPTTTSPLIDPSQVVPSELVRLMWRDKKVQAGKLRFILPTSIGKVELVDVDDQQAIENAIVG